MDCIEYREGDTDLYLSCSNSKHYLIFFSQSFYRNRCQISHICHHVRQNLFRELSSKFYNVKHLKISLTCVRKLAHSSTFSVVRPAVQWCWEGCQSAVLKRSRWILISNGSIWCLLKISAECCHCISKMQLSTRTLSDSP